MNSNTTPKEKATAAYKTFLDQYKADPVAFAQDCLQLEPLDWQSSVMAAVADGERRLSEFDEKAAAAGRQADRGNL